MTIFPARFSLINFFSLVIQIFKSKFTGWDEVIAVDFTRTAESVAKTGADLTKWAKQQDTKVNFFKILLKKKLQVNFSD